MANARRDQNRIAIAMGVSDTDGVTPLPILVDPVTGYVLVTMAESVTTTPPTGVTTARRDANYVPTSLGVSSSSDTAPQAFRTHNGYLLVSFI